jgi:hypothetical protein
MFELYLTRGPAHDYNAVRVPFWKRKSTGVPEATEVLNQQILRRILHTHIHHKHMHLKIAIQPASERDTIATRNTRIKAHC